MGVLAGILLLAGCSSAANNAKTEDSVAWERAAMEAPAASNYGDYSGEKSTMQNRLTGDYTSSYDSADVAEEAEIYAYDSGAQTTSEMQRMDDKIIQTADVELKTDLFDEAVERLRNAATQFGGYVESANMQGDFNSRGSSRYFYIVLRVPTNRFDEARRYVEEQGKVVRSNQSATDVSAEYYDLAGRLETKRIEEERVLDMIGRATKIEDLLNLEERLGWIRTDIERFQSRLNTIDRLAAFSTIRISLNEVTKEEIVIVSDDLGGRVQQAFVKSVNAIVSALQEIVIFLAGAIIPLLLIAILTFVGIAATRAARKKRKKNQEIV